LDDVTYLNIGRKSYLLVSVARRRFAGGVAKKSCKGSHIKETKKRPKNPRSLPHKRNIKKHEFTYSTVGRLVMRSYVEMRKKIVMKQETSGERSGRYPEKGPVNLNLGSGDGY